MKHASSATVIMKLQVFVFYVLIKFCNTPAAWAANILYLSTTAAPSHDIWDKTLLLALRDRQHNLTMLTHASERNTVNITYISLEGVQEFGVNLEPNEVASRNSLQDIKDMFQWLYTTCQLDLETDGFEYLYNSIKNGTRFDLVIMDIVSGQCMYPLIELLESPPVIATSPFGIMPHFTFAFGINIYSSYIPFFAFPYTDQMNFFERANNYFHIMFFLFWHQYMYIPSQARLAQTFFGDDISPLDRIEKNFTLLLANYDPVLNYPHPLPPAIIPVGGLQTKRSSEPVSEDLQNYLDNSKQGVILFSLGASIRSDKLNIQQIKYLLTAFSKLKENVLWKYESSLENLPNNVIVRKWLPQNEILAHPNIKLLITNAGALSTQEAMYHGVPVVGIPFFGDQMTNIGRIIATNAGKELSLQNFTKENIYFTIRDAIDDINYKKNATLMSTKYRDQMSNPLERAVYWVEYVLRHGNMNHLSLASRYMNAYQTLHLDIWTVIISISIIFYLLIFKANCKTRTPVKKIKCN